MPIISRIIIDEASLATNIAKAKATLGPDVIRIRYTIKEDWTAATAIFFRVVLSDHASRDSNLSEIADRVARTLRQDVDAEEFGVHCYFNFRSLSEQTKLNDPAWA